MDPGLCPGGGRAKTWGVPRWLAAMLVGSWPADVLVRGRGAFNARAKQELGWRPRHASWREGFFASDTADSTSQRSSSYPAWIKQFDDPA